MSLLWPWNLNFTHVENIPVKEFLHCIVILLFLTTEAAQNQQGTGGEAANQHAGRGHQEEDQGQ